MAELLCVEHRCLREIVPRRRAVEASFSQLSIVRDRVRAMGDYKIKDCRYLTSIFTFGADWSFWASAKIGAKVGRRWRNGMQVRIEAPFDRETQASEFSYHCKNIYTRVPIEMKHRCSSGRSLVSVLRQCPSSTNGMYVLSHRSTANS